MKPSFGAPEALVFSDSPDEGGPQVTWGLLRENKDEIFRLRCLKKRIEENICRQSAPLAECGYSPYPLVAFTLIGTGALAEIFFGDSSASQAPERNRTVFCRFADRISSRFAQTLQKNFKEQFAYRWATDKPRSGSEILYTFFRNSFIHGYYGRAVYLTGDETDSVTYRPDGCVLLHSWWFYSRFINAVHSILEDALQEQENGPLRKSASKYLENLLADTAPAPVEDLMGNEITN